MSGILSQTRWTVWGATVVEMSSRGRFAALHVGCLVASQKRYTERPHFGQACYNFDEFQHPSQMTTVTLQRT